MLDWLVGLGHLTHRDAVVRENENDLEIRKRGQAHRQAHTVREDQEGRREGDGATVGRDAIGDAAHGVLANTEVDVAAGVSSPPVGRSAPG
ncbi:MAG: hypothetical protein U0075_21300 [Thermomicrobiales bacterium]